MTFNHVRRLIGLAIAGFVTLAGHAFAQSSPGLVYGQVPTAGQWNSYFAAKQDVLGFPPVNKNGDVMTGRLTTALPTSISGFNIPQTSAPASPQNGDVWITSAGIYVRINGSTVGPLVSSTTVALPLTNTHIVVGNASNVGTDVAMSGDATMANTGAVSVTSVAHVATGILPAANGGSISAANYATVALADAAGVAANLPVFLNGNFTLSGVTTLNARWVGAGGVITLGANDLTCGCSAPPYVRMFNRNGAGNVHLTGSLSDPTWWGAPVDGTGDTANYAYWAQLALPAAGGTVHYPQGNFGWASLLQPTSGINHIGDGIGLTKFTFNAASAYTIFYDSAATWHDARISGITFDGSLNYPAGDAVFNGQIAGNTLHVNSTTSGTVSVNQTIYGVGVTPAIITASLGGGNYTIGGGTQTVSAVAMYSGVYKTTYVPVNDAIYTTNSTVSNLTISDIACVNISGGCINISGLTDTNITVKSVLLTKGGYRDQPIYLHADAGFTAAQAMTNIKVYDIVSNTNGPLGYLNAGVADWNASTSTIHLVGVYSGSVAKVFSNYSSESGIRIELSHNVSVTDWHVDNSAAACVNVYNANLDITVSGGNCTNFGRVPPAYAARLYSGTLYAASEWAASSGPSPPLPANPSTTAWWYAWNYSLTGVAPSTFLAYSNSDYSVVSPFRGDAGVQFPSASARVTIQGNTIVGNTTLDGSSLRLYASNFGISPVHPSNAPTTGSGSAAHVGGNQISTFWNYQIYHPSFEDPINAVGAMARSTYDSNQDGSNSLVTNPTSWIHDLPRQAVFTTTPTIASGSAPFTYTQLGFTIVNGVVEVTGQVVFDTVTTPSGQFSISLPFPNASLNQRASVTYFPFVASGLTGLAAGDVFYGDIEPGASIAILRRVNGTTSTDLGALITTGSTLTFDFKYHTPSQ